MTSDLIHLEFACPARTLLSLRLKDISNLLPFNQFTFSIFRTHRKLGNAAERQAQPSPQPVSTTRVSWTDRGVKNRLDGHKFAKLPHKTTVFVRTAWRSSPHCFSCLRALPICWPRSL